MQKETGNARRQRDNDEGKRGNKEKRDDRSLSEMRDKNVQDFRKKVKRL